MFLRRVCAASASNVRTSAAVRFGSSHGHGHGHEQKLLTKLPLGPKYPGGKKWGLFVGVDEDPTTFGRICVCAMSTYLFFVYYYHTGF